MEKLEKGTVAKIVTMYTVERETMRSIAQKMGLSLGSVHKYLKREGIPARKMWEQPEKGEGQ